MDKENLLKVVAPNLRSVVLSVKGGVLLRNLERDYNELLGSSIPYRKMGYNTIEAMLRGMPDVVSVVKDPVTRDLKVIGVADQSTEHIQKMVSKQKESKSKIAAQKRFRISSSRSSSYSSYNSRRFSKPSGGRRVMFNSPPSKPSYSKTPLIFKVHVPPSRPSYKPTPIPIAQQKNVQQYQEPLLSKKGLTLSKTNYEVPPRFLRQTKFQVDNSSQSSGRSSPTVVDEPRSPLGPPITPATVASIKAPMPSVSSRSLEFDIPKPHSIPSTQSSKSSSDSFIPAPLPSPHVQPQPVKSRKTQVLTIPPLPSQLSAKEYVQHYADANGLNVQYKTSGTKQGQFYSVLHLGGQKFYSSKADNKETRTSREAEELAASLAFTHIEEENKKRYPETEFDSPEAIQIFVTRIETIVSETPGGVWSHGMQNKYKDRYQESLPEDWLSFIERNSNLIEFERPESRLEIPHNACILRMVKLSSGATTPTSTSSRTSFSLDEDQHHQVLSNIGNSATSVSRVPPLVLPEIDQWMVYICYVGSTVDMAVCLVEYNPEMEAMFIEMNEFYSSNHPPVQRILRNKLYVAFDENVWHRIQVQDISPDSSEVTCYFVDCGVTGKKSSTDLRELDPRFELLPLQAIHIKLHDLENYAEIVDQESLGSLLDRSMIAKVIERHPSIVVELYDTQGEDDINLNQELKMKTLERLMQNGSLPEVNSTGNFYLINANPDGILSILGTDPSLQILNMEMEKMTPLFETSAGQVPQELSSDQVYAAKYPIDETWVRAVPTGFFEPATEMKPYEVEMYFMDYGNSLLVPLSSIAEIPKWLGDLPRVVEECVMTGVPPVPNHAWTQEGINKLYELAPDMEPLIVRVDEAATEEQPAKVNLFKRNERGEFISINTFFMLNQQFFSKIEKPVDDANTPFSVNSPVFHPMGSSVNEISEQRRPLTSPVTESIPKFATPVLGKKRESYGALNMNSHSATEVCDDVTAENYPTEDIPIPPVEIPKIGEEFDVFIAMVASPTNFIVQPMRTAKALTDLLEEMRKFYSTEENIEMPHCLLKKGNFYAAHHTDGGWYRVKLVADLNKGVDSVTVHFVDYGEFLLMPTTNLQPLWKKFKLLPCQAVKASLTGVKPHFKDWSPEECFLFRREVEEKTFVSRVIRYIPCTEPNWASVILELRLIDTTNPVKDIDISEVLIERKLAIQA